MQRNFARLQLLTSFPLGSLQVQHCVAHKCRDNEVIDPNRTRILNYPPHSIPSHPQLMQGILPRLLLGSMLAPLMGEIIDFTMILGRLCLSTLPAYFSLLLSSLVYVPSPLSRNISLPFNKNPITTLLEKTRANNHFPFNILVT